MCFHANIAKNFKKNFFSRTPLVAASANLTADIDKDVDYAVSK